MKILVIGLGSMGKRRIRNLQANNIINIHGFDQREDRRNEAAQLYGIPVHTAFEAALKEKFDAFIISVPPDKHDIYIADAIKLGTPAFIEASVLDTEFTSFIRQANEKKVLLCPSCTLFYHPAIKKIFEIVRKRELGVISNVVYHSGQYLPDWHTYEAVADYYVSNKATGGAREIVPFELTWLTKLFGYPKKITGFYKKTIHIKGAEDIEDTYNALMEYDGFILNLTVDVVSRYATRRLVINGDKKQLVWSWDQNEIRIFDPEKENWESISYDTLSSQHGYNKNITEQMYIEEIATFLAAIKKVEQFPNTLEDDHKVLRLLYAIEKSNDSNQIQAFA